LLHLFQGVGHTLPLEVQLRAESDACISSRHCKHLLFMYISMCVGDSRSAGHDTKDGGKDDVIADDDRKLLSTGSRVQVSDLI